MRHLTRLLLSINDFPEAKRTFALYVQLVTKARQTAAGDAPQVPHANQEGEISSTGEAVENGVDGSIAGSGGDADDDQMFAEALFFGVRMLCRYGDEDDVDEAVRVYGIAEQVVAENRRWPDPIHARLYTAHGVLCTRMTDFGIHCCTAAYPSAHIDFSL